MKEWFLTFQEDNEKDYLTGMICVIIAAAAFWGTGLYILVN